MLLLQRLRSLGLALGWPALALFAVLRVPGWFERWDNVTGLATLGLAVVGGLIAAGFSQWRLSNGFLLVVMAGAAGQVAGLPAAATLLPILALGILPWLREAGFTGTASLMAGALILVLLALWLRGGTPAALVDHALALPLHWRGESLPLGAALALVVLTATLVRLAVLGTAVDVGLAGALAAMLPVMMPEWVEPGRTAAAAAAVLALWTGLLLHAWRMAYLDELTGLPNRRALEDTLKGLPSRWSLSMVDVDHFKKFNDTWGHDVGDQVLRRVAVALQGVGGRGKAYRYGGEEFSVLFPHDDLDRAAAAIEEVREKIAATPFQVRGQRQGPKKRGTQKARGEQSITVSAGLAAANGDSPANTFKRADQALYKAKKQGRNRLVRAK